MLRVQRNGIRQINTAVLLMCRRKCLDSERRRQYTSSDKPKPEPISPQLLEKLSSDAEFSKRLLCLLPANARQNLKLALAEVEEDSTPGAHCHISEVPRPTTAQYATLIARNGAPFVVFGFIDNSIMILAGETIDLTLGQKFSLSTMSAAALGNMVSDVVGTGFGGMIQAWTDKMRLRNPNLTPQQKALPHVKVLKNASAVIGISFGCILGMWPILLH